MTWTSLLSLRRGGLVAGLIAISPGVAFSQRPNPRLSPDAPRDRPVLTAQRCIWNAMDRAMQPYIAQARASWPRVRQRFLGGLPPRQSFFVTALLVDDADRREQVFIAVDTIRDGRISGKIWNRVDVVHGFHLGDRYSLPESDLRDWLITKPDGSEEGNFVGKFLDKYEPPRSCFTNTIGE
jgi:uncharacterized protein YegJ (DUF2314 family)